jgi:hypothetical protein
MPETGAGVATPAASVPPEDPDPVVVAPTSAPSDPVEPGGEAALPDEVEDDPTRDTGSVHGSPGTGGSSPMDPDTWLATALAELDRIWRSGDDAAPVPAETSAEVPDETPVVVDTGDCVVVLDLAMAGERLAAEVAAPTVRRLVRRLEDRLPPSSRLRDDGPDTVSVVLSGRDRASAAEWLRLVLPGLVDGLAVDAAAGGALLRAAVHDVDGTAGGQILQQLDGTRGRNGAPTQKHRPAARHGVGTPRPSPTGAGSPAAGDEDAGRRASAERRDILSDGTAGSVFETRTAENGIARNGAAGNEVVRGGGSGDPAQGGPVEGAAGDTATSSAMAEGWTPPAEAPELIAVVEPAARRETDIGPRPEPRHDQSGERRPYLPAGVIVRPGTGGRRHRRVEQPGTDDGERAVPGPGPAPSSEPVRVAAPNAGRPSPGPPDKSRLEPGTPNVPTTAAQPTPGTGIDAQPGAPAEVDAAARAEEPDDLGLPSPDGLGLADLLAGALAAYRRI